MTDTRRDQGDSNCKGSLRTRGKFVALSCIMLFGVSGCAIDSPEYSQKINTARTNCTGTEIVGVWVSKMAVPLDEMKSTVLFRPNGTGQLRMKTSIGGASEYDSTWRYVGNGRWEGHGKSRGSMDDFDMTVRYTGSEILLEERYPMAITTHDVLVRAENEGAVANYLKAH